MINIQKNKVVALTSQIIKNIILHLEKTKIFFFYVISGKLLCQTEKRMTLTD